MLLILVCICSYVYNVDTSGKEGRKYTKMLAKTRQNKKNSHGDWGVSPYLFIHIYHIFYSEHELLQFEKLEGKSF